MNPKQIGTNFEKEAVEILKYKFDRVEWLSETKNSTFDFKCWKNGKAFYGDAKVVNSGYNPSLLNRQKEADFVIAKQKDKINIYWKEEFEGNVYVRPVDMESIMVNKETKDLFEEERFKQRMTEKRNIFQDEFINMLLDNFKK